MFFLSMNYLFKNVYCSGLFRLFWTLWSRWVCLEHERVQRQSSLPACVFSGAVLQGAVLSRVKGEERLCVCTELPWGTGSRQ